VQFASVVLAAVLFGVAAAPYGLAIGLPPAAVYSAFSPAGPDSPA
jgi:hypothetical protein